jgi:hypothetical protein
MWSEIAGTAVGMLVVALVRSLWRPRLSRRARLRLAAATFWLMALGCVGLGLAVLLLPSHLNRAAENGGPPTTKDLVIVVGMMAGFVLVFVFFGFWALVQDSPFVRRFASRRWTRWT